MQRSVERVKGVASIRVDIKSGQAEVVYKTGQTAKPTDLWQAVLDSGFTPVRVTVGSEVYLGPKS